MFWLSAALASGLSMPANVYLTDSTCNPIERPSAGAPLRFVFSQAHATSPPGGPVNRWLQTYGPQEVRLRRPDCGVEPGEWKAVDRECDGATVLEWTGELHPGQDYRIEFEAHDFDGFHALHTFRTRGSGRASCAVPPFEPFADASELRVELSVTLPEGAVSAEYGSTIIGLPLQSALIGGGLASPGTLGQAVPDGEIPAHWTEEVKVTRRTLHRFQGPPGCQVTLGRRATLAIDGAQPFHILRTEPPEELEGDCRTLDPPVTEASLLAEIEPRLQGVLDTFETPFQCKSNPEAPRCLTGELEPRAFKRLLRDLPADRPLPLPDLLALIDLAPPSSLERLSPFIESQIELAP